MKKSLLEALEKGTATPEQQELIADILMVINNRGKRYIENDWMYSGDQCVRQLAHGMETAYQMLKGIN